MVDNGDVTVIRIKEQSQPNIQVFTEHSQYARFDATHSEGFTEKP